jgi:membrane protein insertase Oxa1/YidC/SpoIIIJ
LQNNTVQSSKDIQTQQLVEIKNKEKNTLEDYQKAYESESYGLTAYILSKVQLYSIPFCFIGVAISGIYQYVLGIRKLDTRDKGFAIMISIVTIFVIAQILPLIFAIVVKGWRG